ncbi:RNA polymerase II [Halteromyces radiatus]|uniref:RNA polymerase II n=1 Tax=Halteromyces radiatus TaxID=101107 RepID=UPI00221F0F84|nr:RNA polymerase II [Halteromyces radiatus]KAI8096633.1 RNA polymerase II [Halteromyces radiatus]
MIIKNARSALISNFEVYSLLQERNDYQKQVLANQPNVEYPEHLRTIQFEVIEYLKGTPTSTQSVDQVKNFLDQLQPYSLTLGEKLQILNLRPRSAVEIYLLIEECEERFNEEDLENMLSIIINTLPRDDDEQQEDGDMEE